MSTSPTTISINKPLLAEAIRLFGFKTKREAVDTALGELIRRKKIEEAIAAMGTFDIDEEGMHAQEAYGMAKSEKLYKSLDW